MSIYIRGLQSLLITVAVIMLLSGCEQQTNNTNNADNETHPMALSFSLNTPDNQSINLPRVSDSIDIYLFWATWCPYCGQLMPHLQSIKDEYGDRVNVFAINIKENADPIEYMNKNSYDFTLLLDGDNVAELYEVNGTPGVIVVDQKGQLRFDMSTLTAPSSKSLDGLNHRQRSRRIAPWWASKIREQIDQIIVNG